MWEGCISLGSGGQRFPIPASVWCTEWRSTVASCHRELSPLGRKVSYIDLAFSWTVVIVVAWWGECQGGVLEVHVSSIRKYQSSPQRCYCNMKNFLKLSVVDSGVLTYNARCKGRSWFETSLIGGLQWVDPWSHEPFQRPGIYCKRTGAGYL